MFRQRLVSALRGYHSSELQTGGGGRAVYIGCLATAVPTTGFSRASRYVTAILVIVYYSRTACNSACVCKFTQTYSDVACFATSLRCTTTVLLPFRCVTSVQRDIGSLCWYLSPTHNGLLLNQTQYSLVPEILDASPLGIVLAVFQRPLDRAVLDGSSLKRGSIEGVELARALVVLILQYCYIVQQCQGVQGSRVHGCILRRQCCA